MLVGQLRTRPEIGLFDLDHTLTGTKRNQIQAHAHITSKGPLVINTARETGMVMSSKALAASRKYGYERPAPRLGVDPQTKRHIYVDPELLEKYAGHLDPAAIIGFGGGALLRQQEDRGFAPDQKLSSLLGGKNFRSWLWRHLKSIDLNRDLLDALSLLEDTKAFAEGRTDVAPLDWRFQVNAKDEREHTDLKFRIASYFDAIGEGDTIRIKDESKPGKPCFYIVPRLGTKEASADYLLQKALAEAGISVQDVHLTAADDALTGIRMLTDVLVGAPGDFVLPGNAPIAKHLMPSSPEYGKPFAGETVDWLLKLLTATNEEGIYLCRMPNDAPSRRFIIADLACPGTVAVESILALIERGTLYSKP